MDLLGSIMGSMDKPPTPSEREKKMQKGKPVHLDFASQILSIVCLARLLPEGERGRGRERGREGEREGGREWEGGKEEGREREWEGGREREEGGREGGR